MKIMLDTMEYDHLAADTVAYQRIIQLMQEGKVELLSTHIQRDEILAMPNESKRSALEALLNHTTMIGTRGIILGTSRFGQARFGSDEEHKLIEHVRRDRWDRDTEDGLIAATASSDVNVFVTDDKPLTKRLKLANLKCEVINFDEFKNRLGTI